MNAALGPPSEGGIGTPESDVPKVGAVLMHLLLSSRVATWAVPGHRSSHSPQLDSNNRKARMRESAPDHRRPSQYLQANSVHLSVEESHSRM